MDISSRLCTGDGLCVWPLWQAHEAGAEAQGQWTTVEEDDGGEEEGGREQTLLFAQSSTGAAKQRAEAIFKAWAASQPDDAEVRATHSHGRVRCPFMEAECDAQGHRRCPFVHHLSPHVWT